MSRINAVMFTRLCFDYLLILTFFRPIVVSSYSQEGQYGLLYILMDQRLLFPKKIGYLYLKIKASTVYPQKYQEYQASQKYQ